MGATQGGRRRAGPGGTRPQGDGAAGGGPGCGGEARQGGGPGRGGHRTGAAWRGVQRLPPGAPPPWALWAPPGTMWAHLPGQRRPDLGGARGALGCGAKGGRLSPGVSPGLSATRPTPRAICPVSPQPPPRPQAPASRLRPSSGCRGPGGPAPPEPPLPHQPQELLGKKAWPGAAAPGAHHPGGEAGGRERAASPEVGVCLGVPLRGVGTGKAGHGPPSGCAVDRLEAPAQLAGGWAPGGPQGPG